MYDDNCKLTHWTCWLYHMQFPLENRENKNSRNVCLSQIRENFYLYSTFHTQIFKLPECEKVLIIKKKKYKFKVSRNWIEY